jgi:hypothetical protein
MTRLFAAALVLGALLVASPVCHAAKELTRGKPDVKSAGPVAFGPQGVLFLADPRSAAIFAIDTKDTSGDPGKASIHVENLGEKVASLLGTRADQVRIQDLAVNPTSGQVYLSVARGRGPKAQPAIVRIATDGALSEFSLDDVSFAKAALPNPPEDAVSGEGRRRQNKRDEVITDLAYIDGRVIVAGLSNEEFASNLRAIPYPFSEVDQGSSVEIYHGNHGKLETHSPVRTFVPISLGGQPQIIAAYTCTPLVRIPLSELRPGAKVRGTTVAELGNRNRPLDIIAYKKDGKDVLLMANNPRGVMKISTDELGTREGITKPVGGKAGQPYQTLDDWKGVTQLDRLNDSHAIVMIEADGGSELRTLPLP